MANPNFGVRLYPEVLRSIAYTAISGTYAPIGTPLNNPCRILHIVNDTNGLITISFDGINDHDCLPASSFLLLDVTANMTVMGGYLNIAQGQIIYVAGTASSGSVYLASYYAIGTI